MPCHAMQPPRRIVGIAVCDADAMARVLHVFWGAIPTAQSCTDCTDCTALAGTVCESAAAAFLLVPTRA